MIGEPRKISPEESHRLATAPLPTFNIIYPNSGLHHSTSRYNMSHDPLRQQADVVGRGWRANDDSQKK